MSIDIKPLEVVDLSGGITENILAGDIRRYQRADNLLISVDKDLESRSPFVPIDLVNYQLPTGQARVNGMYSFINESILFGQSARKLFTIDPVTQVWTSVLGPSGNEPIQGGDDTAQVTFGEYGHQIYFTSDGGLNGQGILPSKIFRNTSNNWTALTAGLPRAFVPGPFNSGTLLNACITLANALRASFVLHFQDAVNTSFTTPTAVNNTGPSFPSNNSNLHLNQDLYSLSYFQTVNFAGQPIQPVPVPAPAAAATDQTSLFALVQALASAYEFHRKDALAGVNNNSITSLGVSGVVTPNYHYCTSIWGYNQSVTGIKYTRAPAGPHVALGSLNTPTDLVKAATQLNDILQKWNWHRKAVWTHSPLNLQSQFERYVPAATKIINIPVDPLHLNDSIAPNINPDFTDLYTYANNLKKLFNYHVNNGTANSLSPYSDGTQLNMLFHTMIDTPLYGYKQQITLDDVTNEDDFALMTYWLRTMYQMHYNDANNAQGFYKANGTMANGSSTVTGIVYTATATTVTPAVGMFSIASSFLGAPNVNSSKPYLVLSSPGAGSVVLDGTNNFGSSVPLLGFTGSMYHTYTANLPAATVSQNVEQVSDTLSIPSFSVATSTNDWLLLLNDMFNGFLNHTNYGIVHVQSGLLFYNGPTVPGLNTQILSSPFYTPKTSSLAYAFLYSHTYTVEPNGIEYEVFSNPVFSDSLILTKSLPVNYTVPVDQAQAEAQAAGTALPYPQAVIQTTYGNQITNLPSIVNVANTNYDTANIKLEIYRTEDGGTTFYKIASLPNGTTSYLDVTADSLQNGNLPALTSNQLIYTSGGVVGYDQPPVCKYMHFFNNTPYWGAITDTGQFFPNRIIQGNQDSPDHAPATFFIDLEDALSGISSTKSNVIALCKDSLFRLSNGFNTIGQGALTSDKISDEIGCLNAKSIVKTESGVFFAGSDGFYFTDGYQLIKISLELNETYKALTASDGQKQSIYGTYDKTTRRIWWAMKSSPTSPNNNIAYIFYLDFGIKPSGSFTTASNLNNFVPCSWVFQQGVLYYGHSLGYVLKTDDNAKSDALIDTTKTASNWQQLVIPYDWTSCAINMGSSFQRKYITRAHFIGQNEGNVSALPTAIRDMNADGKGIYKLSPINYTDNIMWGTQNIIWGNTPCVWNNFGKFDLYRRLPGSAMRADYIQFRLQPTKVAVYASSVGYPPFANAVIDATLKTATIQTPSGFTNIIWPLDVVGYVIAFQTDGYKNEYQIISLSGGNSVITYLDPSNLSVSNPGGLPWVIRGVKKNQKIKFSSLVVHFGFLGDQVQYYPGSKSNSGPGNGGENPT